jgi:hypothetical protein
LSGCDGHHIFAQFGPGPLHDGKQSVSHHERPLGGHFRFTANGETVVRLEQRLGYVHKGIEAIFPAICDLQGDFRKMQGEPILFPVNLLMVSIAWKKFSRPQGAGRDCGCCREDFGKLQGGAAWNCEWWQGWRRFHFALAGLTMASVRKRTWKIANRRGESGWVVDYTDNRGCQRKHFQTKKAADSFRIKTEGAPTGGGAIVQTMWGTAADRFALQSRVSMRGGFRGHVGYAYDTAGRPPGAYPCCRLP